VNQEGIATAAGLPGRTIAPMPTPPLTPLAAAALHVAPAPERVLEIECGEGEGALFLAREFPAARVRGVDSSPARIRAATARIGLDPEGRVAFKLGRPRALPYPNDFFDLVALLDGRPAVAEIARVLRPGGRLILARSRGAGVARGRGERLLQWRLRRHGIETVERGEAGDGSFSVGRLGAADPAVPSD
jgi:SAM-dependent methyltransferase